MAEIMTNKTRRLNSRTLIVFWSGLIAAVIITLLVYERIDILYVLATISLVALLTIVATSNLEGKTKLSD